MGRMKNTVQHKTVVDAPWINNPHRHAKNKKYKNKILAKRYLKKIAAKRDTAQQIQKIHKFPVEGNIFDVLMYYLLLVKEHIALWIKGQKE